MYDFKFSLAPSFHKISKGESFSTSREDKRRDKTSGELNPLHVSFGESMLVLWPNVWQRIRGGGALSLPVGCHSEGRVCPLMGASSFSDSLPL